MLLVLAVMLLCVGAFQCRAPRRVASQAPTLVICSPEPSPTPDDSVHVEPLLTYADTGNVVPFSPWGGKKRDRKQFSPWGGKRSWAQPLDYYFNSWRQAKTNGDDPKLPELCANKQWSDKRVGVLDTDPEIYDIKPDEILGVEEKRDGFGPWGGKRDGFGAWGGKRDGFSAWGGKRDGFSAWGGKRDGFRAWGGKRDGFGAWGGKRDGFGAWGGKRDGFGAWGGKRDGFGAWGGKRDGFGAWGGKRIIPNNISLVKRDAPNLEDSNAADTTKRNSFKPWGGKRVSFTPWGGKRNSFTPWGGKRGSFTPWGGKRGSLRPWGERRDAFSLGTPISAEKEATVKTMLQKPLMKEKFIPDNPAKKSKF